MLQISLNFYNVHGKKEFGIGLFYVDAPYYLKKEVHQAIIGETDYNGMELYFGGLIKGDNEKDS